MANMVDGSLSYISGVIIILITLLTWESTAIGTTPNIQEIFLGKCWEYQRVINPDGFPTSKDCTDLWNKFQAAFAYKSPCNVTAEDYREFAEAAVHWAGSDRHLCWENVYPFVNEYSQDGKRYVTIVNTLLGYMVDNLMWCGQENAPGINYTDCPSQCAGGNTADYNYWIMASEYYSSSAHGHANAMMNGSVALPFDPNSIFALYELVNLTPEKNVTDLHILVVHNLGGPIVESCGEGSLLDLENQAISQGLQVTCENDPESTRHFQCVDNPGATECSLIQGALAGDRKQMDKYTGQ